MEGRIEDLIIKSQDKLEGRLWLPEKVQNGIVIAPPFRKNFEIPICLDAAEKFYKNGYSVLAFNFLGHGKSGGELRDVCYRSIAENMNSAIEYLKNYVTSKIGVFAVSIGSIATILSQNQPDASIFISPSPLYNPKGLLERYSEYINEDTLNSQGYCEVESKSGRGNFQIGKEWIDEMKNENGEIIKKYFKMADSTLIIQGTGDEPERIGNFNKFIINPKVNYHEVLCGNHEFTNPYHRSGVIKRALSWFNEKL